MGSNMGGPLTDLGSGWGTSLKLPFVEIIIYVTCKQYSISISISSGNWFQLFTQLSVNGLVVSFVYYYYYTTGSY